MCAGTIGHYGNTSRAETTPTRNDVADESIYYELESTEESGRFGMVSNPVSKTGNQSDTRRGTTDSYVADNPLYASVGHRVKEDKLSPNPMYHQTQDFKKSLTTDNYAHTKRDFSQEMSRGYGKLERCEQPTTAEGNIYANPGSLSTGNECDMAGTLQEYSHLNDKRVAKKKKAPHAVVTRDESYSSLGTQK